MQYELCLLLNLKPSTSLLASEQVFNKNLLQPHEDFLHLTMKSCQNVFLNHFPTNESLTFMYSHSQKSSAFGHCAGEWKHCEPLISHLAKFGQENFEWNTEEKLKCEMSSQVWEGAFLQMLYSVRGFVFNFNAHWHLSNEDSLSRNL